MQLIPFAKCHIPAAADLLRKNFQEAASHRNLPPVDVFPDPSSFLENNLGMAAFEDNRLTGFLCGHAFENAFRIPGLKGFFSPLHGHGAAADCDRAKTYARLYEAVAENCAEQGIASHGIAVYSHDEETIGQFFRYGFGMRCGDAIRPTAGVSLPDFDRFVFRELAECDLSLVLPLENKLAEHMGTSPIFFPGPPATLENLKQQLQDGQRIFLAQDKQNGEAAAYLKITDEAETFLTVLPQVRNICGAFCLPKFRGRPAPGRPGLMEDFISWLCYTLHGEGITWLGVDYESTNPSAFAFWTRHFCAYTMGLVRRIDETALKRHR